ncbi:hypothetical protein MHK74_08665 [Microbacterium aurum]|nr:hypothetical protein [Microbacterium aurum]MCG7414636.1 hypothetical protein [Microbacterium aurum]
MSHERRGFPVVAPSAVILRCEAFQQRAKSLRTLELLALAHRLVPGVRRR